MQNLNNDITGRLFGNIDNNNGFCLNVFLIIHYGRGVAYIDIYMYDVGKKWQCATRCGARSLDESAPTRAIKNGKTFQKKFR